MSRRPKPTAVKEASGALRKNPKRRNTREPKPPAGWPDCPTHIRKDKQAYAEWSRACEMLASMKVLTKADYWMLWFLIDDIVAMEKMKAYLDKNGPTITGSKGQVSTAPEAREIHKYKDRALKIAIECGLSPATRSKIIADTGEDPSSGMDRLLSIMGAGKN